MMDNMQSEYILAKFKRELLGKIEIVKQEQEEFRKENRYDSASIEEKMNSLTDVLILLTEIEAEAVLGEEVEA